MDITLIRHTRPAVAPGTCYGWSDVDVADTFAQEAAQTKRQLDELPAFDAVFTSPLQRARKLAAACGYPGATTDERLREMSMGRWEMMRYEEISDPYIEQWYADYLRLPTPGGESFPIFYERVADFLSELSREPHAHVAIFAHGGVLACAGIWAGLWRREEAFRQMTPFGGLLRVCLDRRDMNL